MALLLSGYQPLIAQRMAAGDKELLQWLDHATFAKAATGHFIAWRPDDPGRFVVLPPEHPTGTPCIQFESLDTDCTPEDTIEYVESGQFEADPPGELNICIEDPETGRPL
ncbi:MAG: hypothetical protein Q4G39_03355 [Brachymonas sp.]|nr:hypothetical protein [Brachymonas sp.]